MHHDLPATKPRRRVWRWVLLGSGALVLLAVGGLIQLLTLDRDAAALRRGVLDSCHDGSATKIQLTLDGPTLGILRLGLAFAKLPEEARLALKAVHRASVGVYELKGELTRATLREAADAAMDRRGYVRLVGVTSPDETVLVYAPTDTPEDRLKLCVAACEKGQLVIAAVQVETGPLVTLVERQAKLSRRPNPAL